MSIDARIIGVTRTADELPRLNLEGRKEGESPGQPVLFVRNAPKDLESFIGSEIWGNASQLLIGDKKVADRINYYVIEWLAPSECQSCGGYGFFSEDGHPSLDRRDQMCLDCRGTGKQ